MSSKLLENFVAILIFILICLLLIISQQDSSFVVGEGEDVKEEVVKENYIDEPQNVHNSEINLALGKKYARLVSLSGFDDSVVLDPVVVEGVVAAILEYSRYRTRVEFKRISYCLSYVVKGGMFTSFGPSIREDFILVIVWLRVCECERLRELLILALLDCVPRRKPGKIIVGDVSDPIERRYSLVCMNGRVARMLGVFTLVDPDPILGAAELDYNTIRVMAFARASSILDTEYLLHPELAEVSDLSDPRHVSVEKHVKNKINTFIHNEYSSLLPKHLLDRLSLEACSGV